MECNEEDQHGKLIDFSIDRRAAIDEARLTRELGEQYWGVANFVIMFQMLSKDLLDSNGGNLSRNSL